MKAFWEIFKLEFVGFVRSRALALLSVASVAWMFAEPYVFRADGTDEGAREMCVRFSLGGVATLLAIALLITAAGSLSRERAAKRLQLTMVRPVRLFALVVAKVAALSLAGALVLAMAVAVEAVRQDGSRKCSSVYRPILPSPAEEAAAMYESYMADPETPAAVKKAKKSVVMRLLTQRAIDHYQTIGTNETATWKFSYVAENGEKGERGEKGEKGEKVKGEGEQWNVNIPSLITHHSSLITNLAMRFRFTNMYEMRDEVRGRIFADGYAAAISNITQAIVKIPLVAEKGERGEMGERGERGEKVRGEGFALSFANDGARPVMLRPRKDVELLVEVDGFVANLMRAYLQLVGMLTLLVAFGVFLGAGLSRPVAVFVAVVVLALSEMSPSVVEQYPDELETDRLDAIGLTLARFTATVTHPVGSLRPLSALAADERVEPREVARTLFADAVIIPILLALLAAFILPRKQDEL